MKNWRYVPLFLLTVVNLQGNLSAEVPYSYSHYKELASAATAPALTASYIIESSWPEGYQVLVTIKNPSTIASTTWTSTFILPANQTVATLWNGDDSVSGSMHTVTSPTWFEGGVIPAGQSTTYGLVVLRPLLGDTALNSLAVAANGNKPIPPIPTAPAAPTLSPITVSSTTPNSYTASWNAVDNATSYQLQQSTIAAFTSPTTIVTGDVFTHSFNNQPNGTYYYRVTASNATGTSVPSKVQTIAISVPTTLTAPALTAIANTTKASQYTVQWGTVTNALGYILEESISSAFANPVAVLSGTGTSYTFAGKAPGTYYYRVIAYGTNQLSPPSAVKSTVVVKQTPFTGAVPFLDSYWESWNSVSSFTAIADMKVDVMSIAFGNFTTTGTHTFVVAGLDTDPVSISEFITAVHSVGKKVKISIGGATYPLSAQLQTTADAVGMAQAITNYVKANKLDGVDLDIEDYPAPPLQIALIQNLRQLLGPAALISYTPKTPAYLTTPYMEVIQGAHQYMTSISFMAYDYEPGYAWQQDVDGLLAMGVPASKLVIGLMPGLDDLQALTSVANIKTAATYAVQHGLGGIMFWDLNRDHENSDGLGIDAATTAAYAILHP